MSLKAFQQAFYDLTLGSCDWTCPPEALDHWLQERVSPDVAALFRKQSAERLRQYQWMVFGNLLDTLEAVYPFTRQLLDADWEAIVRDFLRAHPPQSFQLYHCITAFPTFLQTQPAFMADFPFLGELATYEVLEADLLRRAEPSPVLPNPEFDSPSFPVLENLPADISNTELLSRYAPVLNPVAESLECRYPIHTLIERLKAARAASSCEGENRVYSPELAIQPQPLALWVYRDRHFSCRFFQVNALTLNFLERCRALPPMSAASSSGSYPVYDVLLQQSLDALNLPRADWIEQQFGAFIHQLVDRDILRGHIKPE